MPITRRPMLAAFSALLATLCAPRPAAAAGPDPFTDKLLQLGTGPVGGAFRPIGTAVCDAANEDRRATLVRCVPVGTAGSTFNLQAVAAGSLELGLAQEDLVAGFVDGGADGADRLRVVAVLHSSPIAVMAHPAAGIQTLQQVLGKRFNLGNRGSGQFTVTASILRAMGVDEAALGGVSHFPTNEFQKRFCAREADVVVEAVAHPAEVFRQLARCGGQLLNLPDSVRQRMQEHNRWLRVMTIPAGTYPGQTTDVQTLGMRNVLVSSSAVSDEAIYRFTQSLSRRLAAATVVEPMLGSVQPLAMSSGGPLPTKLHRGADRALRAGALG